MSYTVNFKVWDPDLKDTMASRHVGLDSIVESLDLYKDRDLVKAFSLDTLPKSVINYFVAQGARRALQSVILANGEDAGNAEKICRDMVGFLAGEKPARAQRESKVREWILRAVHRLLEESGQHRDFAEIAAKAETWDEERWERMEKRKDVRKMVTLLKAENRKVGENDPLDID